MLRERPVAPTLQGGNIVAAKQQSRAQLARIGIHPLREQAIEVVKPSRCSLALVLGDEALLLQVRDHPADRAMRHACQRRQLTVWKVDARGVAQQREHNLQTRGLKRPA